MPTSKLSLVSVVLASLACGACTAGPPGGGTREAAQAKQDENGPLQVGDRAPDFRLLSQNNQLVSLESTLQSGPVVLTWYRGGWCPYCNTELAALQKALPEFEKLGVTVIALSPETQENALGTTEKLGLRFLVLTDDENQIAKKYRLDFELDERTVRRYSGFGIDVAATNDSAKHELPIPATYVIDTDGVIRFAYTDDDYRKRADVDDVVAAAAKLSEG